MWSPGYFRADLTPDRPVTLIASAEPWSVINAIGPSEAVAAERLPSVLAPPLRAVGAR